MPIRAHKNILYAAALPLIGRQCRWRHAEITGESRPDTLAAVERVWKRHYTVGGCVQVIRNGQAAETCTVGFASLHPRRPVRADTVFRTASIAKAVCALLVLRLKTLGKLSVEEDISDFWHREIRNPYHPQVKIPLGSLLSHTSGFADTPRYFRSFTEEITADELLSDPASYSRHLPYRAFRYSNFGAGLIGSLLEARFNIGFEDLIQRELFLPLGVQATFDIRRADVRRLADGYRVLPPGRAAFDAQRRFHAAAPIGAPNPQRHFLLASGNLFITAGEMAKLCLLVMRQGMHDGTAFLNAASMDNLFDVSHGGAERWPGMRHGMGLFTLEDGAVFPRRLYGHQGFAYGAVNGFFFDGNGNGLVSFNSGASERRAGRLSCLNRDLIRAVIAED
ncbi:MAG: serine hydrolase domain-containing protein [Bacillota bacterium]